MNDTWRGYDLAVRKQKITRTLAFAPVTAATDVPLIINTSCYFAFSSRDKPTDYFTSPASMVRYQEAGWAKHLAAVSDDAVPYFMPWYGTGVLATAFGAEVRLPQAPDSDPSICGPVITQPGDVARLRRPDPERDGLMPTVLRTIAWAKAHSDLPVGLTDMNSPLSTAAQLVGYDRLFAWMFDEPAAVHDLMGLVTDAFIAWVRLQKERIGEPLDASNGLQGTWSPPGVGVWASDDDLVAIGPQQYQTFVAPCMERAFTAFGGGSLHFCGNGSHQARLISGLPGVRVVNNSPMGKLDSFSKLYASLRGRIAIQLQDNNPLDPATYYRGLFARIEDLRGIMLVSFVLDSHAMTLTGGLQPVDRDPRVAAQATVEAIRELLAERLARQPATLAALAP